VALGHHYFLTGEILNILQWSTEVLENISSYIKVAYNGRQFPQLRNLTRTPGGFPVKTVSIYCLLVLSCKLVCQYGTIHVEKRTYYKQARVKVVHDVRCYVTEQNPSYSDDVLTALLLLIHPTSGLRI
jgi:hypothetical protein